VTEHRQHPRKSLVCPVAFQVGTAPRVDASCRDISLGGMFIETEQPAPYGAEVVIHISLPGLREEATIRSTVRWTKRGAGMGVQFGVMGARETHALIELIQSP
jgi:type IV pilus assembly protein PilZ